MLGSNPLIHQTGGSEAYVTQQAEAAGASANMAAKVPFDMSAILIISGLGLLLLKLGDFRFVASGSGSVGKG